MADLNRDHESLRIRHNDAAAAQAQQLAEMRTELESARAALQQFEADRLAATRTADELRNNVAALEQALQKVHEEHTLAREETRRQADSERLALQSEWESRVQHQREAHERALSEERIRAATELSSAVASAEDQRRQLVSTLSALRAEAEALRLERDSHAVGKAEAHSLREEVERRLHEEIVLLSAEVERRRAEERDAGQRERDLLERLRNLETTIETEQERNSRLSEDHRQVLAQADAARVDAVAVIAVLREEQAAARARAEVLRRELATWQQASSQAAAERDRVASERQQDQERFAAEVARFEEERTAARSQRDDLTHRFDEVTATLVATNNLRENEQIRSTQRDAALAENRAERDRLVAALAQEKDHSDAEREEWQKPACGGQLGNASKRALLTQKEIEQFRAQVDALRQERDRLAAEKSHTEGTLAARAEQLPGKPPRPRGHASVRPERASKPNWRHCGPRRTDCARNWFITPRTGLDSSPGTRSGRSNSTPSDSSTIKSGRLFKRMPHKCGKSAIAPRLWPRRRPLNGIG